MKSWKTVSLVLAVCLLFAVSWIARGVVAGDQPAVAGDQPAPLRTGIVSWNDSRITSGDWGEMRISFEGASYGTANAFTAIAVIKPGESVHPAHRHAEEEFLVVTKGEGRWHVAGKEYPAKEGDVLYVEPWVMHGLVNTGSEPLTFFVVKWNSKGVTPLPEPTGDHGR